MPYADKEKQRAYWRRKYWRNREKESKRHLTYYYAHREEINEKRRNRERINTLHLSNGKRIRGLNKRPRPDDCELCSKNHRMLAYHHWDDNNYNLGIWVCRGCHYMVGAIDKGIVVRYETLKKFAEASFPTPKKENGTMTERSTTLN